MSKRVQLSVKERNAAIRSKISEMLEAERFGGKVKAEVVGVTNNFFRFAAKLGYLERREDNQYRVLVKFTDEVINHVYTEVRSYYSDWKEKWGENFKNKKVSTNHATQKEFVYDGIHANGIALMPDDDALRFFVKQTDPEPTTEKLIYSGPQDMEYHLKSVAEHFNAMALLWSCRKDN